MECPCQSITCKNCHKHIGEIVDVPINIVCQFCKEDNHYDYECM
jgi:hypothetical protein